MENINHFPCGAKLHHAFFSGLLPSRFSLLTSYSSGPIYCSNGANGLNPGSRGVCRFPMPPEHSRPNGDQRRSPDDIGHADNETIHTPPPAGIVFHGRCPVMREHPILLSAGWAERSSTAGGGARTSGCTAGATRGRAGAWMLELPPGEAEGSGGWETIEMVRKYAHLARELPGHARKRGHVSSTAGQINGSGNKNAAWPGGVIA